MALPFQPILHVEIADAPEFPRVVGDQCQAGCTGKRADQEVVESDGLSRGLKLCADAAIFPISGSFERQHQDRSEQALDPRKQPGRSCLRAALAQFCRDDYRGTDLPIRELFDAACRQSKRISDNVADDIRVEAVSDHRICSGMAGMSWISGKSSSGPSGASAFHIASNSPRLDGLLTGSMMSLVPSRLIRTRLPGSSNSTGILTA